VHCQHQSRYRHLAQHSKGRRHPTQLSRGDQRHRDRCRLARKSDTANKEYVSLFIAAPEFGPKKLYTNLDEAAGSNDKDLYAAYWNRFGKTKTPAQDLHGGNHL
jgi:hypothetical protein